VAATASSVRAGAGLSRGLDLSAATAIVVGGTIGVGIFLTPAGMARDLASPGLLFTVWAFMGAAAVCGAVSLGELAARFPEAGGIYVYLRETYGRGAGFLYGWKCLLVMDPGLTAALAMGLGAYVQILAPALPPKVVGLAAIALVAAANVGGVRLAGGVTHALTIAKVGLLLFLVAWGFLSGAGDAARFDPFFGRRPGAPALVGAIAGGVVQAFFSFGGWWEMSRLTGEVRDPVRNVPRALALGVAVVTALYIAVSAVFVYLVPLETVNSPETFAAQAGFALFGAAGGRVLAAVVALSVLGSLFAFMTSAPRVYYAMARDGTMPGFAGRIDGRTGVPVRAVLLQAGLAALLVVLGTFDTVVAYFVFVTVAFLGLTVAGVFVLRRRHGPPPAPAPLFPWTPAVFLASIVVVLALLASARSSQALLGVAVVAAGLPVYRWILWRQNP
jgi:APA family basic amino acid/polyamine antiporter